MYFLLDAFDHFVLLIWVFCCDTLKRCSTIFMLLFKNYIIMKKHYFIVLLISALSLQSAFAQGEKYFIDFQGVNPLSNLPVGVTNVNGTQTVRVKNTTDFAAVPNAVQDNPNNVGQKELFLDFHGYLRFQLDNPAAFSIAYNYRRTNDNDDWWLGFLTFIGFDGTNHRLEQFVIRQWDGQLHYDNNNSANSPVSFNTNYHIVLTSSNGSVKAYVDGVLVLNVPYNASNNKNIHQWTNASLLMSFKGNSYNGTTVTPEPDFSSNARDARVFVDNISLFDREITPGEVAILFQNGNNTLSTTNFEAKNVLIYPNPVKADNLVHVSNADVKSVKIYDLLGKEVKEQVINNSTFSVDGLSTGTYLVRFFGNEGSPVGVSKVIKQ